MLVIPEFWRSEIWHPLTVHFPIVLLIIAPLLYIVSLIIRRQAWTEVSYVLLWLGTLGAWIAVYTGNIADSVVSREICDPMVLETHETNAYIVAGIFSGASVLAFINRLRFWSKWFHIGLVTLLLVGSGFLAYTGHLGAQLVYQQGAGVYHPTDDCSEFE